MEGGGTRRGGVGVRDEIKGKQPVMTNSPEAVSESRTNTLLSKGSTCHRSERKCNLRPDDGNLSGIVSISEERAGLFGCY